MNFYTFSSNKNIKSFFLITLITFLTLNIVLNIALWVYVDRKTNKFSFIEEKVSKAKHMKLQDNSNQLDYIFIGSSRTIYHISTQQFEKNGIKIYNYGSSDRGLIDYPFMLKEAMSLKPKSIVISISIPSLFQGGLGNYKQLTLEDLPYVFKFKNIIEFNEALYNYVLNKNLLFKHSEPMHIRLSTLYNSFNPKKKIDLQLVSSKKNQPVADCNIIDLNYPSTNKIVAKCTNGDGVLFGNTISDVNKSKKFSQLNETYIAMLNLLLSNINKNRIKPILILEPVFRQNYDYNISMIKQKVHGDIIDLTKMSFTDENWADNSHLNVKGRESYTKKLINILHK